MIRVDNYKYIVENMPVVCVDGLIVNQNGEYLLVKRKNEPLKGEYWVPGGRLLKNEKLEDAIRRKMVEEVGIGVKILRLIGFFEVVFDKTHLDLKGGFHAVSFVFLLNPLEENIVLDNQSSGWKWFKELPPMLLDILQPFGEVKI